MSRKGSSEKQPASAQGVVIASSHPLFRDGLVRLMRKHEGQPVEVLGTATTTEEALAVLARFSPALVVVDYDDQQIDRKRLLRHFMEDGEGATRLVLVSLNNEGQIIVYDRRTLAPAQVEDWLA